ncbi:MAG: hypothetical protein GY811_11270 [Myxococcales bacterium]|nr:hypothetical protein [Myxococcales bacterium]
MQRREALSSTATKVVRRAPRCCLILLCFLMVAACGPIEYVNQVTRKASSQVAAAKAVKADKHAPYWYTLAVEYLHKAREEAAAADFQAANRFGKRSEKAARKARSVAIERARDPGSRPELVPADDEIEIIDPSSDEARADEEDNLLHDETEETP